MVLSRSRFDWQSLQIDRATAFGLALAGNALIFGLLTLPFTGAPEKRLFLTPDEIVVPDVIRREPLPETKPVPPPPVPPDRPRPVLQPIIESVAPAVPQAPVFVETSPVAESVQQAVVGEVGPSVPDYVEAQARYGYSPHPAYPGVAIRKRLEGDVLLRVRVDAEGRVLAVEIERSSGHRDLDRAAERQIRERWRFQPAQREGRAVSSWVRVPISFRLGNG